MKFTYFIRFELGSDITGSLMTFFATHPILAINPVKVAESLDVFTSLQSDIFFDKQKKN